MNSPLRRCVFAVLLFLYAAAGHAVNDSAAGVSLLAGQVTLEIVVPDDPDATAALRPVVDGIGTIVASDGGRVADIELTLPPTAIIRLTGTPAFIPPPLPGFGAVYGVVRAVVIDDDGQQTLEPGPTGVDESDWIGVRNRFYTVVVTGVATDDADIAIDRENEPVMTLRPAAGHVKLRLYAGPVEYRTLRSVDPRLSKMLFAALWDWLRWLCFGMLWLLTTIDAVIGNIGWSIVLLSLAVKVLMLPLTKFADHLQASVNRTQAQLQPRLDAIKRDYKGEEAHERTLAVYRELDVSPLYTLKSLIGFLIQIPVFIAAFDMLGENIALSGASFWWVRDLAAPDHWLALPFTLPFFGGYLNLLPVLMTAVTFLTSWLQKDPNLTPALMRAQRQRLFWMAGAFFLLFYTFPAGMVLYWTTNNVLHLAKIAISAVGQRQV